jgi:hypothetical protein
MDPNHTVDENDLAADEEGTGSELALAGDGAGGGGGGAEKKGNGTGFLSVNQLVGLGKSFSEFYVRAIFDTPSESRPSLVEAVGTMDAEAKVRTLSLLKSLSDEQKVDLVSLLIKLGTGEHRSALTQAVVGMSDDEFMAMVDEMLDLDDRHRLVLINAINALDVAAKPAFIDAVLMGVAVAKKALIMVAVDGMNASERGQAIGAMGDMEESDKRTLMEAFSDGTNQPMSGDGMRDLLALIAAMQVDEKRLIIRSLTEVGQEYRCGVVSSMIGTADPEKMAVLSLLASFPQTDGLPPQQQLDKVGEDGAGAATDAADGADGADGADAADAGAEETVENAEEAAGGDEKPSTSTSRFSRKKDKKKSQKDKSSRFSLTRKKEAKVEVEMESARDGFCRLFVSALSGGLLNTERGEIIRMLKQLHGLDAVDMWSKQPEPVSTPAKLTADLEQEGESKAGEGKEGEGNGEGEDAGEDAGEGDSLLAEGGDRPGTSESAASRPGSAKSSAGGRPSSKGFGFGRKAKPEPWVDPQEALLTKECMRSLLTLMAAMGDHTSLRLRLCNTVAYFLPPQTPSPSAGAPTSVDDDGGAAVIAAVTAACGSHARPLSDLVPLFMTVAQRLLLLHGGNSSSSALAILDLFLRSILPLITATTADLALSTAISASGGIPAPGGSDPIWPAAGRQPDRRADLRFGSMDGYGSAAGRSAGIVSEPRWVRARMLLLALEGILKAPHPDSSVGKPLAGGTGGDSDPYCTPARRERLAKAQAFMMARLEPSRRRQPNVIENDDLRPSGSNATQQPLGLALGGLPEVDPGGRAATAR